MSQTSFATIKAMIPNDWSVPMLLQVAIPIIRSITMISCTINMPILSLPEVDSISSLSESNFKTTMVLLNANPIAKKIPVIPPNPNNEATRYPNTHVMRTWKTPAINDVLPRSLMMVGLSSMPTIKSKRQIPRFPNDWNAVFAWSNHGIKILIAVPAIIYPMIIGCFKNFINPVLKSTIQIIILSEVNIFSTISCIGAKTKSCIVIIW